MRGLGSILLVIFAALSIGCKGSDSSSSSDSTKTVIVNNGVVITESDGRCTQSMIDIHNDVISKHTAAKNQARYSSRIDITELKSACDKYKATIGSHSCIATNTKTAARTTMSSSSLDTDCLVTATVQETDTITTPQPQAETSNGAQPDPTETEKKCSPQASSDLESFKEAVDLYSISPGIYALARIDLACIKLKTSLGTQPCLYRLNTISYDTNFKSLCDKTAALMKEAAGMGTDGSLVLVLTPLQPKTLTGLTKNSVTAYFKAGTTVKSREALGKKGPYCLLDRSTNLALSATTEITLDKIKFDSVSGITQLSDDGSDLVLSCGYIEKSVPLKLADLKTVLNNWFKIEEIK